MKKHENYIEKGLYDMAKNLMEDGSLTQRVRIVSFGVYILIM